MRNPLEDPVPEDRVQRVRAFARDLAYGVAMGLCSPEIGVMRYGGGQKDLYDPEGEGIGFLWEKWQDDTMPFLSLLVAFGYFENLGTLTGNAELYRLTEKTFALLEQPAPTSILISYRRGESSAFALLVLSRFKALGLEPFLDMNIEPGDEWHARIQHEVTSREHFVSLIGPTTLESKYVRQEILWALDAGAQIIPIWHNGFDDARLAGFQAQYSELGAYFEKQAIRVEQENAVAYVAAIIQLLNRFGVTPS